MKKVAIDDKDKVIELEGDDEREAIQTNLPHREQHYKDSFTKFPEYEVHHFNSNTRHSCELANKRKHPLVTGLNR
jgi:hypothetical protein